MSINADFYSNFKQCKQLFPSEPCAITQEFTFSSQLSPMPFKGLSFAEISPRKPRFDPRPVYMGFVVVKVTMEQVSLRVPLFPQLLSCPFLHTNSFTCHRRSMILATESVFQQPTEKNNHIVL